MLEDICVNFNLNYLNGANLSQEVEEAIIAN